MKLSIALCYYPKLKDMIMTAATQLRREGEKIGIQRDIQNRNLEIAKSMLKKGFATKDIKEMTGLSKEAIQQLKKG